MLSNYRYAIMTRTQHPPTIKATTLRKLDSIESLMQRGFFAHKYKCTEKGGVKNMGLESFDGLIDSVFEKNGKKCYVGLSTNSNHINPEIKYFFSVEEISAYNGEQKRIA